MESLNNFMKVITEQKYNNEYTLQALDMGISEIKSLIEKLEAELNNK